MNIGIDLGTTFSLAAYLEGDGTPMLAQDQIFKKNTTPPSVYLGGSGALVGWQAQGRFEQNPDQTRLISSFQTHFGEKKTIAMDPQGNAWSAEALAALLLKKLRHDVEKQVGKKVEGAVITVPAHFNENQRKGVHDAASLAGIQLLGLLDEPVAAAMHYGFSANDQAREKICLIYDLGGSTFDATVLGFHPESGIDVLSQGSHSGLGGREFDDIVQSFIAQTLQSDFGPDFNWSAYALVQLKKVAEEVKIEFSDPTTYFVRKRVSIGAWQKEITFTRQYFEEHAAQIIEQTIQISKKCLSDADIAMERIDAFLLVGGSSQIPIVRQALETKLQIDPKKILVHHPMNAVAFGAAMHAEQLSGSSDSIGLSGGYRGITGYHAGIRTIHPVTGEVQVEVLIRKNTSLKSKGIKVFKTRSAVQDHILLELVQFFVSPDDAIVIGQLVIGPIAQPALNYEIEVCLEHMPDGRLFIRATDLRTGREMRHSFANADADTAWLLHQKSLVEATIVNTIGE
jgi:molecular chaperone DnaK